VNPSQPDPLRRLLESYQREGQVTEEGVFTIDPERAVELLRAQGQLGQNAPLYLLSAIHQHTGGQPVRRDLGLRQLRLRWAPEYGPLPSSLARELALSAFAAHHVGLSWLPHGVALQPTPRAEELLQQSAPRLRHYPWKDGVGEPPRPPLGSAVREGARLAVMLPERPWTQFEHVLHGVSYASRWSLPVDAVCHDPLARADLSLQTVPDSARKERLMAAAEELLLELLRDSLEEASEVLLDPAAPDQPLPLFVQLLPYLLRQSRLPELAERASCRVRWPDANGGSWSVAQLREVYERDGKLLFVPWESAPQPLQGADRPVLLWGGRAAEIGQALFATLAPGEGYLYSLAVNWREREQRLGEKPVAHRELTEGSLSLLPWGDPDRPAEVEFVGPRRARLTHYLDPKVPRGMRLLWESKQGLEGSGDPPPLEGALRHTVLELLDTALPLVSLPRETLLDALLWAAQGGPLDYSRLPRLREMPLLEQAGGGWVCLSQLLELVHSEPLWVLSDRSSSLPQELPVSPLLWWHPLLDRLGLPTRDASRLVREAHWRQSGRQAWLAAHSPREPDWPPLARQQDGHLVAANPESPQAPTEVLFWREGRPFGRRILSPDECPPGYLLTWVEDELPGDTYWSGPHPAALRDRLPAIARLCCPPSNEPTASSPGAP
jgi:hypothetical protein